jgi:hypothetical protein
MRYLNIVKIALPSALTLMLICDADGVAAELGDAGDASIAAAVAGLDADTGRRREEMPAWKGVRGVVPSIRRCLVTVETNN